MDDDFDLYGDEEPVSILPSPAIQTIKLEPKVINPIISEDTKDSKDDSKDDYYKQMYTSQTKDFQDKPGPKGLIISELTWFTSEADLALIIEETGYLSHLIPKETTFQDYRINGKSKGIVYLQFTSHLAALASKEMIEKIEIHDKRPIVLLHNEIKSGNPFKSLANEQNQPSVQMGNESNQGQASSGPQRSANQQINQQNQGYRPYPARGGFHQR